MHNFINIGVNIYCLKLLYAKYAFLIGTYNKCCTYCDYLNTEMLNNFCS